MKKIFLFMIVFSINAFSLFCSNDCISEKKEKVVSGAVLDVCENLQQIIVSYQIGQDQAVSLLQSSFNLTSQLLEKDKDNYLQVRSLFSNLVCDLFSVFEMNKIRLSSFGRSFKHIKELEKSKTRDSRRIITQKIIESGDKKELKEFTDEFFTVFSGYLRKEINIVLKDVKDRLLFYLEDDLVQDLDEPVVFRKNKKKRRKAAAIFAAIANACINLAKIIVGKTEKDKKEGVLNLAATAFGLASDISAINAQEKGFKLERDTILDKTVPLVQNLYTFIKQNNIIIMDKEQTYWIEILDSLDSDAKKKAWLAQVLVSRDLTKKLLKAIFKCLKTCMHYVTNSLLDLINDKLLDYLSEKKG